MPVMTVNYRTLRARYRQTLDEATRQLAGRHMLAWRRLYIVACTLYHRYREARGA